MADPHSDSEKSSRLPFEPVSQRQKQTKQPPKSVKAAAAKDVTAPARESMAIPQVVSQRMVRRMAFFCGLPSALGIATFLVSYFIVKNNILPLPNAAVVLVSMGFFGLGVIGLSYGVISASWDEERPGGLVGWSDFTLNLGRLTEAWRSAGKKSS